MQGAREDDQVDVHGIEDQLDGHEDDHDIAAREYAHGADEQQRGAQGQVVYGPDRLHVQILFLAMTTEPTTATRSKTEAISNGSRYSRKSESATCSVFPTAS